MKTKALELDDELARVQFVTPSPGYKGSEQVADAETGTLIRVPNDKEHEVDALLDCALAEKGSRSNRNTRNGTLANEVLIRKTRLARNFRQRTRKPPKLGALR